LNISAARHRLTLGMTAMAMLTDRPLNALSTIHMKGKTPDLRTGFKMVISQHDIDAMSGPHLVGITGRAGSGKSAASDALVEAGWVRMKFASPLKDMLRAIGLTDQHIEGDLKEVPCDLLCGQTPRHAMITLGTEWGREMIGGNFWMNIAANRIATAMAAGINVVVDDVRFDNEADLIRRLGGVVLGLERDNVLAIDHKSEAGVTADMIYRNDGSAAELRGYMISVFAQLGEWE